MTVSGAAQQLRVAAAADLQPVLPQIAKQFEQKTGAKVSLIFGSSGALAAQIENGAPYDVFLSADAETPAKLESDGAADKATDRVYALGHLSALFANATKCIGRQCLDILLAPRYRHIAIANPAHAPYGRAALAALKAAGIYQQLAPKLVFGENVAQTAQFVLTGNAEAALVSNTACKSVAQLCIPLDSPPLEQHAVVLVHSVNQVLAKRFLDDLISPAVRQMFMKQGYDLPVLQTQ